MKIGVVGGGVAGLATAWAATRSGHQITLFEQGPIPNPLSASGDHHRIIRRGYAGQDGYARTVLDAFAAWETLWSDLGARHYEQTGVLSVSMAAGDQGEEYAEGYRRMGTPHQTLSGAEAEARFPFLDGATIREAAFTEEGGLLFCRHIARDLAAWLRRAGATLHENTVVERVDAEAGALFANGERFGFDAVVVAAGAWSPGLFQDLTERLTTYRTHVVYLDPPEDLAAAWAAGPAFISTGPASVDGYLLPPRRGAGLKFGAGATKFPARADERRTPEPGEGESLRDLFGPPIARIGEYKVAEVLTCAYGFTEDHRFLAQRRGRAWIVSACSGHGYKFGAAVGLRVAESLETGDEAALSRWMEAR